MKPCTKSQGSVSPRRNGAATVGKQTSNGKMKDYDLYTIMMWGSSATTPEDVGLHWLVVNIHGSPKTTLEESLHTGDTIVPYKLASETAAKYTYHLGIFRQHDAIPYIKLQRQKFDVNDFIKMYDLCKLSEQVKKV